MKRVAIIGGGPAGLCAAKNFIYNKLNGGVQFEPVIFEQQQEVGGTWVYRDIDKSNTGPVQGFSSIYKNLVTNLPKQVMCYPDYPFPEDAPTFPHHTAVLKYIKDYAEHFDLYKYIRFNTKVTSVNPIKQIKSNLDKNEARFIQWKITTQDVCTLKDLSNAYDAVLVCSGNLYGPVFRPISFEEWLYRDHGPNDENQIAGSSRNNSSLNNQQSRQDSFSDETKENNSGSDNTTSCQNNSRWSKEQTDTLVGLWKEYFKDLESKKSYETWSKIREQVNLKCSVKTIVQCKNKIRNIKDAYKRAKENNKKSGNSPNFPPYYHEVDDILGSRDVTGLRQVGASSPVQILQSDEDRENHVNASGNGNQAITEEADMNDKTNEDTTEPPPKMRKKKIKSRRKELR